MTIPELIEILKAAEAGKVIEWQGEVTKLWSPLSEQSAVNIARNVAANFNLRVKPEPREWWAAIYNNGGMCMFSSKEQMEQHTRHGCGEVFKVREIIP